MKTYGERLKIPVYGAAIPLFTKSGLWISAGYQRIVIGERGPYMEFNDDQIEHKHIYVPGDQQWRLDHQLSFYNEYRTTQDNVKVYHQKKAVDYADYVVGMWYISPFDLRSVDNGILIEELKRKPKSKTKSFLEEIE